jgi:hypothetical protein
MMNLVVLRESVEARRGRVVVGKTRTSAIQFNSLRLYPHSHYKKIKITFITFKPFLINNQTVSRSSVIDSELSRKNYSSISHNCVWKRLKSLVPNQINEFKSHINNGLWLFIVKILLEVYQNYSPFLFLFTCMCFRQILSKL